MNIKHIGFIVLCILWVFPVVALADKVVGTDEQVLANHNLDMAAQGNSIEGVRYALKSGANVNNAPLARGRPSPAIMWAITHKNLAMVSLLVKNGANTNFKDVKGYSALMHASEHGTTGIVRVLLQHKARIDDVDKLKRTALMHATHSRRAGAVELLVAEGANRAMVNSQDKTALQTALSLQYFEIIRLLVTIEELQNLHKSKRGDFI